LRRGPHEHHPAQDQVRCVRLRGDPLLLRRRLRRRQEEGTAENEGHGGPTHITPHALQQRLDAYGATLPRATSTIVDEKDPTGFFTYPQTGETLIDELLEAHLVERDVKRAMAKRILFTVAGEKGIFQSNAAKTAAQFQRWLADPALAAKLKAEKVLNLLPLAEAVALYKASAR
jgi:hypothetical protein